MQDLDETFFERICGLAEMFPEGLRSTTCSMVDNSVKLVKSTYNFGRHSVWIAFTSAMVLFGPVWIEIERSAIERELQRQVRSSF